MVSLYRPPPAPSASQSSFTYNGGLGTGRVATPALNQPPVQYPQLTQLPYFLPNPRGFGQNIGQGMPFIRNQTLMNTLAPLMQPNYGVGMSGGPMPGASPYPIMGGGLGSGGLQMPGLARWGIQPMGGGAIA